MPLAISSPKLGSDQLGNNDLGQYKNIYWNIRYKKYARAWSKPHWRKKKWYVNRRGSTIICVGNIVNLT